MIAPQKRPNILLICTDQQGADAMSAAGNPYLHTPAMDALAARGTRYTRAYCTNPICVPSRASLFTGRPPHELGINHNMTPVGLTAPCLGRLMADAGYDTAYTGKWHIPHEHGDVAWHGFAHLDFIQDNGNDRYLAEACESYFAQPHEAPFFLVASFVNPHDICEWARQASGIPDVLLNGELPPPPPPEECPPLPENHAIPQPEPSVIRDLQRDPLAERTYPVTDWDQGKWRQYRWAYYRLVELVDQEIGRLLAALERSGRAEETVIIFTSDHGDGAAAHQWNQKTLLYEECARVPFVVVDPRQNHLAGTTSKRFVSNGLDLAATCLDLAGAELPPGYEGQSVRADSPGHMFVVTETELAPVYGQGSGIHGRMLRTERYKYCRYSCGEHQEQLFDLEQDPGEIRNRAYEPEFRGVVQEHRDLLEQWMKETDDPVLALLATSSTVA